MQIKKLRISIIFALLNSTNSIPLNEIGEKFNAIKSFMFGKTINQSDSNYLPNYNKPIVKTTESKPLYTKSTVPSITSNEKTKITNVATSSNILVKPVQSKLFNDINPLALLMLNDGMDMDSLLPFMLLNQQSTNGNDMNLNMLLPFLISGKMEFSKLLPFLLMQNAGNSNNLLMFMLMKNLLNKNSGSSDLSDILYLSMFNKKKSNKSYTPINKPQLGLDIKPVLKPIIKDLVKTNKTEIDNNEKSEIPSSIQNILKDAEDQKEDSNSTVVEEQKMSLESILNAAVGMELMAIIDPKEGSGDD